MCGIIPCVFSLFCLFLLSFATDFKRYFLFVAIWDDCRKGIIQNYPYYFYRWATRLNFALSKGF